MTGARTLSMVDKSRVGKQMLERNFPKLQNLGLGFILLREIMGFFTKVNDRLFAGFLISQSLRLNSNRDINSAVRIF